MNTLQKVVLYKLILFAIVSAVLGLYAILTPELGTLEGQILGTSLTITLASIAVLPCLRQISQALSPIGWLGASLNTIAALMLINTIWEDPFQIVDHQGDYYYFNVMFSCMAAGLTCSHVSLLVMSGLYKLQNAFLSLVLTAGVICSLAFGAQVTSLIWSDVVNERLLTASGLLVACFTVVIPVCGFLYSKKASVLEGPAEEAA